MDLREKTARSKNKIEIPNEKKRGECPINKTTKKLITKK